MVFHFRPIKFCISYLNTLLRSRFSNVFGKTYPVGMEIVAKKMCSKSFTPTTKMTTDAIWNVSMGTFAIHLERRKGKGGSVWDGVTRHEKIRKSGTTGKGEVMLSCRCDGSPLAVIVMGGCGCGCSSERR